jgi:hypothetical protein
MTEVRDCHTCKHAFRPFGFLPEEIKQLLVNSKCASGGYIGYITFGKTREHSTCLIDGNVWWTEKGRCFNGKYEKGEITINIVNDPMG